MSKKKSLGVIIGRRYILKNDARLLYRAFLHPQTPIKIKLAMIGAILYMIAPIDILPDWIFVFGLIDDIGIIVLIIKWIKKNIPQKLKDELDGKIIVMNKK